MTTQNARIHLDMSQRPWSEDDLFFALAWRDAASVRRLLRDRPKKLDERLPCGATVAEFADWAGAADLIPEVHPTVHPRRLCA